MSRDPEEYPDPESFEPERFLQDSPPRDPADYVFGFGRRCVRISPGSRERPAKHTLSLSLGSVLADTSA